MLVPKASSSMEEMRSYAEAPVMLAESPPSVCRPVLVTTMRWSGKTPGKVPLPEVALLCCSAHTHIQCEGTLLYPLCMASPNSKFEKEYMYES